MSPMSMYFITITITNRYQIITVSGERSIPQPVMRTCTTSSSYAGRWVQDQTVPYRALSVEGFQEEALGVSEH